MSIRLGAVRHLLVPLTITTALLGGCVVQPEPVVTATVGPPNVVTYPEGRYQAYGDGSATPYYWVWIPAGTAPPPPPPPPPPRPGVTYRDGRYQLYGDGSTTPYYWVWIPAGSTAYAPPPPPRRF